MHHVQKIAIAAALAAAFMGMPRLEAAGDAAKGKETFNSTCAVCHNADSTEKKMGPGLKGLFKHDKLVNGKKPTDANVLEKINTGGNGMPAYKDMLSDEDKDNVVAYLKTL